MRMLRSNRRSSQQSDGSRVWRWAAVPIVNHIVIVCQCTWGLGPQASSYPQLETHWAYPTPFQFCSDPANRFVRDRVLLVLSRKLRNQTCCRMRFANIVEIIIVQSNMWISTARMNGKTERLLIIGKVNWSCVLHPSENNWKKIQQILRMSWLYFHAKFIVERAGFVRVANALLKWCWRVLTSLPPSLSLTPFRSCSHSSSIFQLNWKYPYHEEIIAVGL